MYLIGKKEASFVLNTVKGFLRGNPDYEDVAQEALLRAWRNLSKFQGGSSLTTWLYRIAINTSLMHLRSARNYANKLAAVDTDIPTSGIEDKVSARQTLRLVDKVLDANSERDGEMFKMLLTGMSNVAISKRMGVHKVTVRTAVCRSRRRIRESLAA